MENSTQIQKLAGIAILFSDMLDFKPKVIARDKVGLYTLIKGTIQQDEIRIINIYALNIGTLKFIKQKLLDKKGQTYTNTVIVSDINTPESQVASKPHKKIQQRNIS